MVPQDRNLGTWRFPKAKGEQTMKTKQKPPKRKQKSHKRPLRPSRPADLGQSEAALEKASEEELKHMGDAEAAQAARKQKQGVQTK
jgi:hypothetical protein